MITEELQDRVWAMLPKEFKGGVRIDGWVARDEDGCLNLFNREPERIADCTWCVYPGDLGLGLPKEYFPDLKWSDSPQSVTITIKPKKI